jgi:hypothetical protein
MRTRPTRATLLEDGPPIRLTDLAALTAFSPDKLHNDAQTGRLRIKWARCGQRQMAMVERPEALRYLETVYLEESA